MITIKIKEIGKIIYQADGIERPILILTNPPLQHTDSTISPWPNPNIAYYCSSGTSNQDNLSIKTIFQGTWIPIGGLLEHEINYSGNGKRLKGHIIKMSDLYFGILGETCKFLKWHETFIEKMYPEINLILNEAPYYKTLDELSDDKLKNLQGIMLEFLTVLTFISAYFLNEWQLKLSAMIGGGYWDKNIKLKSYVNNIDFLEIDDKNKINNKIMFELESYNGNA
jgi:hypothetical protein